MKINQIYGSPVSDISLPAFLHSSFIIVHKDHAGMIIGKNGYRIKQICDLSNTWIHIQEPNEWSFGHPWFAIKGRSENFVAHAHHILYQESMIAEAKLPRWVYGSLIDEDYNNIDEYFACADTCKEIYQIRKEHDELLRIDDALNAFEIQSYFDELDEQANKENELYEELLRKTPFHEFITFEELDNLEMNVGLQHIDKTCKLSLPFDDDMMESIETPVPDPYSDFLEDSYIYEMTPIPEKSTICNSTHLSYDVPKNKDNSCMFIDITKSRLYQKRINRKSHKTSPHPFKIISHI